MVSVELMVVEGSAFDVTIGDPTMEKLGGIIDLGNRQVSLIKGIYTLDIPLIRNYFCGKPVTERTDTEEFSSAT